MAKTNTPKIPIGAANLRNLINKSKETEENFIQDKKDALNKKIGQKGKGSTPDITAGNETISPEVKPDKETIQTKGNETVIEPEQSEKFNIRERVKEKEQKESTFNYEDFFQKYYPDEGERRRTAYLYDGNLQLIETLAKIEKTYVTDLLNNIVSGFIYENQESIRKTLKKPSKLLG